jgi:hypothetical protein
LAQRLADRPGVGTSGEIAAWETLRERVTITLRPVAEPVSLGLFGLAAATFVLAGLQLGWVDAGEGRNAAFVAIGFSFVAGTPREPGVRGRL